jgi:hypothetical protein
VNAKEINHSASIGPNWGQSQVDHRLSRNQYLSRISLCVAVKAVYSLIVGNNIKRRATECESIAHK